MRGLRTDCPSGKVTYNHKKHAQGALETLHRVHRHQKRWRLYRCNLCQKWHLTTQPQRAKAASGR